MRRRRFGRDHTVQLNRTEQAGAKQERDRQEDRVRCVLVEKRRTADHVEAGRIEYRTEPGQAQLRVVVGGAQFFRFFGHQIRYESDDHRANKTADLKGAWR